MATKPRRPLVKSELLQTETDADAERLEASGRDSMPRRIAGETVKEVALFGTLSLADREFFVKSRETIHRRITITSRTCFSIGDTLIVGKAKAPHGTYTPWVEDVIGISMLVAQYYSGTARSFVGDEIRETVSCLDPSSLYALSGEDACIVALRTEIILEMKAGARPTSNEIEARVAAALGQPIPNVKSSTKSKRTAANAAQESEMFDANVIESDSATEKVVECIFSMCIDRVDELLSLLKPAKAENVGKLLIRKCESYCDCVDTAYTPVCHPEIASIIADIKQIPSLGR